MKLLKLFAFLWLALTAHAQTQSAAPQEQNGTSDQAAWVILNAHYVALSWTDSLNPPGTTYSVYRSIGDCTTGWQRFAVIANGIAQTSFADRRVAGVTYCYFVTANYQGAESSPSNLTTAQAIGGTRATVVQ